MIEKVNPQHPDKIADRIAGAMVDYAYTKQTRPKIAVEVLIGHGRVYIIAETSVTIPKDTIDNIVQRIAGLPTADYTEVPQDQALSLNQQKGVRAGDNGIFKGVPINQEVNRLSEIARRIHALYPTDGKYILDQNRLIICQSNATEEQIKAIFATQYDFIINPLGYWTGGLEADTGATNRKLGSDMGEAVTGGGLHGKDLSKADVSVNIYAHIKAQETGTTVELSCAIGDDNIDGKPYTEIVSVAEDYIRKLGGFEKLAEWGLV